MKKAVHAHPTNRVLQAEYKRLDEERVKYVWWALDTAEAEHLQGWRYLEDGSDFVNAMLIKYEGDLSQRTQIERAQSEYIEVLEEAQQQLIKNG
ncbi:hypothetical protein [Levilactobacillus sp. HBUAS67488]